MRARRVAGALFVLVSGSLALGACGEVAALVDGSINNCPGGQHPGYTGECEANCTVDSCGVDATCNTDSGACEYRSCYHLKQAVARLPDGVYQIRPNADQPGGTAYCAGDWTYKRIGFGNYNQDLGPAFKGWDQIRVADLQNNLTQGAVVWGYNRQSGLTNISPGGTGAECCFKSAYDGQGDISVGGLSLTPANLNGDANCGGPYTDSAMRIASGGASVSMLTGNFFAAGVSIGPQCAEGDNPALFAERYSGFATCQQIGDASLWEGIGIYTVDPDGLGPESPREAVCGAASGDTIGDVAIGRAGETYAGYQQITASSLTDPAVQLAFLRTYGRNDGLPNLEPGLTVQSCCLASNTAVVAFDGESVEITHDSAAACTAAFTEPYIKLRVTAGVLDALPRNYFATSTPTMIAGSCGAATTKPALFIQRN